MKIPVLKVLIALTALVCFAGSANAVPAFTITPSAVSNTYSGKLTLLITSLTSGETVVVQKFLDLNGNGVVDAGDRLMQQFTLTDGQAGMVIGGVTNFNVPGDYDTTTGQITAKMLFADGDFAQSIVGNYLFVVSSPTGAATNSFAVTNFPFAQKLTGRVLKNGVGAPGAVVIVFPPPSGGNQGLGSPVALTLADGSGNYTVALPAGSYLPFAFGSNAVANVQASPVLTLNASQTITTNLMLTNATATITGQIVDSSNPSLGLPGIFLPVSTKTGLIASTGSDTNGNFTVGVLPGTWQFEGEPSGLLLHGYVGYQGHTNVNAGTSFTAPFLKANALFYGQVVDALGNPLSDIDIYVSDNNGQFQSDSYTDNKGNYVIGAVGGLGGDTWNVQVSTGGGGANPTNYVFSQPAFDQNGGTNLNAGQAVLVNFIALVATNSISGNVQFNGTNVVGVGVSANAIINGQNYNAYVDTDTNGNYSLNVANGSWSVGLNCNGGNDSLDGILGVGNYQCPSSQNVAIANNNGAANFTVLPNNGSGQIFGYVRNTGSQPITNVTVYVNNGVGNNYSTNTDSNGYYSFIVAGGSWGVSVDCGQLNSLGYQCAGTNYISISGDSVEQDFTVSSNIPQSLQINTTSLPDGTNGVFYNQTFQASGGTPPYNWFIPNYSATPPPTLSLATNGILSGTPMMNGKFYFDVIVTDAASNTVEEDGLALTILNNPPLPPVLITNTSLPGGAVGVPYSAQLGATGGQTPYNWSLAVGSANPPPGLTLYSSGLISGTPTTGGTYYFEVQAADAYSTTTNKVLSIAVSATVIKPTISSARYSGNQFQMLLNGVSNQNYTIEMSTNLSTTNWVTLYVTNNPATDSFLLTDPGATNKQRFYRILIGP